MCAPCVCEGGMPTPDGAASPAMAQGWRDVVGQGNGRATIPAGASEEGANKMEAPDAAPAMYSRGKSGKPEGKKEQLFQKFEEGTRLPYTGQEDANEGLLCFLCGDGGFRFCKNSFFSTNSPLSMHRYAYSTSHGNSIPDRNLISLVLCTNNV